MPTERRAPDAVLDSSNYTTLNLADIDEDPDSPDGAWGTWDGNGDTICRVSFPTPSGNPTTGAGLQEFRVLIRKTASGGFDTPWSLELWENGVLVSVLATGTTTSLTGEVVSGTWNATSLGTADGSLVECYLAQTSGGAGTPASRRGVEVGAVEWNVTYDAALSQISATLNNPATTVTGTLLGAGVLAATNAGTSSGDTSTLTASGELDGQSDGTSTTSSPGLYASIASTEAGTSTASATLLGAGVLAATEAGSSSGDTSTLLGAGVLAGTSAGTSSGDTSTALAIGELASTEAGTSTASATVLGAGALTSTEAGTSTASATVLGAGVLAGTSAGVAGHTATISSTGGTTVLSTLSSFSTGTTDGAGSDSATRVVQDQTAALANGVPYIVLYEGGSNPDGATGITTAADVRFGSTEYAISSGFFGAFDPPDGAVRTGRVSGFFVVTGNGSDTVSIGTWRVNGSAGNTVLYSGGGIKAIPLDSLTQNTHYWLHQGENNTTADTTPTGGSGYTQVGGSITFTAPTSGDYLVIFCVEAQHQTDATTSDAIQVRFRQTTDPNGSPTTITLGAGDNSGQLSPATQLYAPSSSPDSIQVHLRYEAVVSLTASTEYEFFVEAASPSGGGNTEYRRERIIAFDGSAWDGGFQTDITTIGDQQTSPATITFGPLSIPSPSPSTHEYTFLAGTTFHNNSSWHRSRISLGGTAFPATGGWGSGGQVNGVTTTSDFHLLTGLAEDDVSAAYNVSFQVTYDNADCPVGFALGESGGEGTDPAIASYVIAWRMITSIGAPSGAMTGTIAGTSTTSGTMLGAGALAATNASTSTATGTMTGSGALASTEAGTSTATATALGTGALASTEAGTSTATATVLGAGELAGQADGTSTGTATASSDGPISATEAGTSTATATLFATGDLASTEAGTSTATGTAIGIGALASTEAGTSTATATALGVGALAGQADGTSTATATADSEGAIAATEAGTSTVTGTLLGAGALAVTEAGTSTATGTMLGAGVLAGQSDGTSTATFVDIWGALTDEFEDTALDAKWTIEDVNTAIGSYFESGGEFVLPITLGGSSGSFWYSANTGVLVYQNVTGDFEVRVDIEAENSTGTGSPGVSDFKITGIAAHDPVRTLLNYVHIGVGSTDTVDLRVEYKNTIDSVTGPDGDTYPGFGSVSNPSGRAEVRLQRHGQRFVTSWRATPGSGAWSVILDVDRTPDPLPSTLRVGMMTYQNVATVDLRGAFRYVRFSQLIGFEDITATDAGTSTATATLLGAGALAATEAGTSTATLESDPGATAGATAGTSTATATLLATGALAVTEAGTSTATATALADGELAATEASTSTATATATATGALTATEAGSATATATLLAEGELDATVAGTSTATATASSEGAIAATEAGTSTASATLLATGELDATAAGTSTATLSVDEGAMTASVGGVATATATLLATGELDALDAATSTASATATATGELDVAAAGTSTASATATAAGELDALEACAATAIATLIATGVLASTVASAATTSGTVLATGELDGTAAGVATVVGDAVDGTIWEGSAAGTSAATADLEATGDLAGPAIGFATATAAITFESAVPMYGPTTATHSGATSTSAVVTYARTRATHRSES